MNQMIERADPPTPLATYKETRFEGKRLFELREDSIRVTGTIALQGRFETTIPLSLITPVINKLQVRSPTFWSGALILQVGLVGYAILVSGFQHDPVGFASLLILSVGLSGVALCFSTWRKTEYARFHSDAGVVILDIARSGPDCNNYEHFVNQVLLQILRTRALD